MKNLFTFNFPEEVLKQSTSMEECPEHYRPKISYAQAYHIAAPQLELVTQRFIGSNIYTALLHTGVKKAVSVNIQIHQSLVGYFYVTEGDIAFLLKDQPRVVSVAQDKCFIAYIPAGAYTLSLLPGKGTVAFFVLHPRMVQKMFEHYPELEVPFTNLLQESPDPTIHHLRAMSKFMHLQLRNIGGLSQNRLFAVESAILGHFNELLEAHLQQLGKHQYSHMGRLEIAIRVYEYIRDHALIGGLPKIEELADKFNIGHRTLLREFKNRFGVTLKDFITAEKMDAAHYLLTKDGLSIHEVSQRLGYGDPQSFSRKFKNNFGYLPSDAKNHTR